jgi:hypothetical protein
MYTFAMSAKKDANKTIPLHVWVEFYRANRTEVASLKKSLKSTEGIRGIGEVARMSVGGVELGTLFTVYVLPALVNYAGPKVLKFVEDQVREWFKKNGREDQFITLKLSAPSSRKRKIGKGKPRRGEKYY